MPSLLGKAFVSLAAAAAISSCASGGRSGIPIPGEEAAIERNIALEYFSIAENYMEQKKYQKALDCYNLAMRNSALHDSALCRAALCRAHLKDWDGASSAFSALLSRDPENSTLRSSLAYIEAMRGNLRKAETMYEDLVARFPNDGEILRNYISVLLAEKKTGDAAVMIAVMEEKFPDEKSLPKFKKAAGMK